MSKRKSGGDQPTDITLSRGDLIQDDDSSEGGVTEIKESYIDILNQLGVDTRAMSLEEIRAEIQKRKGSFKSGNRFDLKTGKRIQEESTQGKKKGRTYKVKLSQDEMLTASEFDVDRSDEEYKKKSDKQNSPVPSIPFNPKPKP